PVDVLGDEVRQPAADVGVEHAGRAEPGHPLRGDDLLGEALPEHRVVAQVLVQDLDGDGTAGAVVTEVDGTHAAGAETPRDPVRTDCGHASTMRHARHDG